MALSPVARLAAQRLGVMDRPVGIKIHDRPTPLMGGAAMYVAFALATVVVLPLTHAVTGLLLGGLVAVTVGLIDERLTLNPLWHLLGQCAAAAAAIVGGVGVIGSVSIPICSLTCPGLRIPAALGLLATLLWLVGMINTVNFLDGLDGLAAGIVALAALLLAAWAAEPQRFYLVPSAHHEDLLLPLALAGAILGFLPYNWHRARMFMGDSGSTFLGLAIGALAIVGPAKLATALLVLIIPVLDVAWAIVRRRLQGRSFASADKHHFYHRMLHLGLGYRSTVLSLYALCFGIGLLDLLLVKAAKLVAFVAVAAGPAAALVVLEARAGSRIGSAPLALKTEAAHAPEDHKREGVAGEGVSQPVLAKIDDRKQNEEHPESK
jgi:UDP-GlcNAc:undecaprenyl-phosphate GlcNAc-1-phosphate transferase